MLDVRRGAGGMRRNPGNIWLRQLCEGGAGVWSLQVEETTQIGQ